MLKNTTFNREHAQERIHRMLSKNLKVEEVQCVKQQHIWVFPRTLLYNPSATPLIQFYTNSTSWYNRFPACAKRDVAEVVFALAWTVLETDFASNIAYGVRYYHNMI